MESTIIKDKTLFHDYDIRRNSDKCRDICRNRSREIPTFKAIQQGLLLLQMNIRTFK
jgi:hypothetical protein